MSEEENLTTYTYKGKLVLSNAVDNVTFSISGLIIYSISSTLTNVTADTSNPQNIIQTKTASLKFTANEGYELPDTITVTNASYTWNKTTGIVELSNPTGKVTITIEGVAVLPKLDTPINVSVSEYTATFDKVENAMTYEFFVDGVSIGTYEVISYEQDGSVVTIYTAPFSQSGTEVTI